MLFCGSQSRWVKRLIAGKQYDQARAYMDHVTDQALTILKHRSVSALFTIQTQAIAEKKRFGESRYQGSILWRNNHGQAVCRIPCRKGLTREVKLDLSQLTEIPS